MRCLDSYLDAPVILTLPESRDGKALRYARKVRVGLDGPWGPQFQLSHYTAV